MTSLTSLLSNIGFSTQTPREVALEKINILTPLIEQYLALTGETGHSVAIAREMKKINFKKFPPGVKSFFFKQIINSIEAYEAPDIGVEEKSKVEQKKAQLIDSVLSESICSPSEPITLQTMSRGTRAFVENLLNQPHFTLSYLAKIFENSENYSADDFFKPSCVDALECINQKTKTLNSPPQQQLAGLILATVICEMLQQTFSSLNRHLPYYREVKEQVNRLLNILLEHEEMLKAFNTEKLKELDILYPNVISSRLQYYFANIRTVSNLAPLFLNLGCIFNFSLIEKKYFCHDIYTHNPDLVATLSYLDEPSSVVKYLTHCLNSTTNCATSLTPDKYVSLVVVNMSSYEKKLLNFLVSLKNLSLQELAQTYSFISESDRPALEMIKSVLEHEVSVLSLIRPVYTKELLLEIISNFNIPLLEKSALYNQSIKNFDETLFQCFDNCYEQLQLDDKMFLQIFESLWPWEQVSNREKELVKTVLSRMNAEDLNFYSRAISKKIVNSPEELVDYINIIKDKKQLNHSLLALSAPPQQTASKSSIKI